MATTQNSMDIKASPEKLYKAFTDPKALETWLAPGEMYGKVHDFNLQVGGGYQMSLYYPEADDTSPGKTAAKEDRFHARFLELKPNEKIVQAIKFDTGHPDLSAEMIMETTFVKKAMATTVTILFKNIPSGIRPEDNEAGTRSSLEKLARYVA